MAKTMPYETIMAVVAIVLVGLAIFFWNKDKKPEKTQDDSFTVDMTAKAKAGKLEKVVGMEKITERLIHVLARKQKNNPLLIGEPGVGKTAVVEGLAQRIVAGDVPEDFKGMCILGLSLADLMAGTKYRGALEQRLQAMIKNLEEHSRETILFIDEIHMLEQARGSEGSLDIADILKPALSRGDLQVIGATTWDEYEKFLKPDAAIERRFQPVLVEEPSEKTAIAILTGVKESYEKFHGVCIPQETIEAAVQDSIHFVKNRFLPDKAFDVIDEACAKVSIEAERHEASALGLVHAASAKAKTECGGENPIVTPEDVHQVAKEWHAHQETPHH